MTSTRFERAQNGGTATERIVIQATSKEKKAITDKAKRLGLPVSELMRRGTTAYDSTEDEEELGALAGAALLAATRGAAAIDEMLAFVRASNERISAMENRAAHDREAA